MLETLACLKNDADEDDDNEDDNEDDDDDDNDDDVNNHDNNDDDIELCAKHAKVQLSITQACVPETRMSMDNQVMFFLRISREASRHDVSRGDQIIPSSLEVAKPYHLY